MPQFVKQNRNEQQQRRQQGQPPTQGQGRRWFQGLAVMLLERQRRQHQNHEPGRMDAQRDAANLQKCPAFSHVQRCSGARGPGAAVELRS